VQWSGKVVAAVRPGSSPTIVLLHGLASNSASWETVINHLTCPNVVVDLPGHGHSTPVEDYSYTAKAAVVREVARDLEIGHWCWLPTHGEDGSPCPQRRC